MSSVCQPQWKILCEHSTGFKKRDEEEEEEEEKNWATFSSHTFNPN